MVLRLGVAPGVILRPGVVLEVVMVMGPGVVPEVVMGPGVVPDVVQLGFLGVAGFGSWVRVFRWFWSHLWYPFQSGLFPVPAPDGVCTCLASGWLPA